jgi:hypothetical protein
MEGGVGLSVYGSIRARGAKAGLTHAFPTPPPVSNTSHRMPLSWASDDGRTGNCSEWLLHQNE